MGSVDHRPAGWLELLLQAAGTDHHATRHGAVLPDPPRTTARSEVATRSENPLAPSQGQARAGTAAQASGREHAAHRSEQAGSRVGRDHGTRTHQSPWQAAAKTLRQAARPLVHLPGASGDAARQQWQREGITSHGHIPQSHRWLSFSMACRSVRWRSIRRCYRSTTRNGCVSGNSRSSTPGICHSAGLSRYDHDDDKQAHLEFLRRLIAPTIPGWGSDRPSRLNANIGLCGSVTLGSRVALPDHSGNSLTTGSDRPGSSFCAQLRLGVVAFLIQINAWPGASIIRSFALESLEADGIVMSFGGFPGMGESFLGMGEKYHLLSCGPELRRAEEQLHRNGEVKYSDGAINYRDTPARSFDCVPTVDCPVLRRSCFE
jgi:hypothetical protein